MRQAAGFMVVAMVVAGCGGGEATTPSTIASDAAATSARTVDDTTTTVPSSTADPTATAVAASEPAATSAPSPAGPDGAALIEVLTPAEGNGARPLLAWSPVPDADLYSLILLTVDGRGYWAWTGTATSIYLGGSIEPPPADTTGPVLFEPMRLRVVAHTESGDPVGVSLMTPIGP